MKILEQFFLITGICANISIMYIHFKFYKMAYRNDGDERLNLKDKNFNINYVDNTNNKDKDRQVDAMDVLDKVVDKLRSDEKGGMEEDKTTSTREMEEEGYLSQEEKEEDNSTTQTAGDMEEDLHLKHGEIEDRLRRASDVDEEDVEGEGGNWARYLSFGVK